MNKKILIVDDEKEIVDLLEVYLSNDGYSVYKCYNGLEAMKCIKQSQIDLAILDIMLPDIDGFRLCQKIREKEYHGNRLFAVCGRFGALLDGAHQSLCGACGAVHQKYRRPALRICVHGAVCRRPR